MGKLRTLVLMVLVLALLPAVVSAGTAQAVVGVDDVTVQEGQEFTVPVWIANVESLYGADVRLAYDMTMLQGVRVDHGNFLRQPWWVIRQGFWQPGPWCPSQCAWYALTQLRPATPQSGSGIMVYVTFRALRPGTTNLTTLAQLSAAGGVPIPVNVDHGVVKIIDAGSEQ